MATLYIVGTPIGNLEDISMRALRILGEVDFILCEDTRVTKRLLDHYRVNTHTISYHQHSDLKKTDRILEMLASGKDLALVSDAGTPGISDPGGKLIQAVLKKFGSPSPLEGEACPPNWRGRGEVTIESVPGPTAITAALSISGVPTDKFVFMGFPPHKKGRQTFINKILTSEFPVVVYESKHRIVKFLEELKRAANEGLIDPKELKKSKPSYAKPACRQGRASEGKKKKVDLTSVVVCRELSKMHETVYRGDIKKIIENIKESKNDQKGEFVVIIGK